MDTSEQYRKSIANPTEPLEKVERVRWYEDPVYIKMSDCEEIQKYKAELGLTHGDYIYNRVSLDWGIIYDATRSFRYGLLECIWLPTQDQLQEMVGKQAYDLVRPFYLWCFDNCLDICNYSMEQLWLAFYMKTEHGKTWDGNKWVT